jgi:hypothetical protein
MELVTRQDGRYGWRINVGDDVVATDGSQGYENKKDALHSLFGVFFGDWDESFLTLYADWQAYHPDQYTKVPGTEDGPPVRIVGGDPMRRDDDPVHLDPGAGAHDYSDGPPVVPADHRDENTDETSDT